MRHKDGVHGRVYKKNLREGCKNYDVVIFNDSEFFSSKVYVIAEFIRTSVQVTPVYPMGGWGSSRRAPAGDPL